MNYSELTHGRLTGLNTYVIYLDYGGLQVTGMPTEAAAYRIFQIVAECLVPAGLSITNKLPVNLRPGAYTTVKMQYNIGWRNVSGNCPHKQIRNTSWYQACNVYVGGTSMSPDFWGYVAAHEAAHSIGGIDSNHEEELVNGYPNLMSATKFQKGRLSDSSIKDIKETVFRFNKGERFGFHYVSGDLSGKIANDWHSIGP